MLKDIPNKKVEDVAIAIVPQTSEQEFWEVFLLNLKEKEIRGVLINARGYHKAEDENEVRKTSTLRHFFEEIPALSAILIEPIQPDVFDFTNEYWLSFSFEGHLFDKKYIFVRGSISEELLTDIPILNRKGIMIK